MGICDIIPGVSGGTIAFITGIYTRLINAVKSFSLKLVYDLITYPISRKTEQLKKDFKKLDLGFLVVLGVGIACAFLAGSKLIKFLLENYFSYTLSFFIGLILASSRTIFTHIENHSMKNILFCFLGLVLGIGLNFLVPREITTPGLGYVFLGGICAISAMFLPGISGAFILLIMGLYEFMIDVLHDIGDHIRYFLVFIAGAALGAFGISRIISALFEKNRCRTLYVLLGLVVGALSTPLRKIIDTGPFNFIAVLVMVLCFLAGACLVILLDYYQRAHAQKPLIHLEKYSDEKKQP